jgi:small-conductance mechanosensitive channel
VGVIAFIDRLGLPGWAAAILALCLSALLAILVRMALFAVAKALTKRKAPLYMDVLLEAVRKPLTLLLFLIGVVFALSLAELPGRLGTVPKRAVAVLTIFVAAYAVGRGLLALLRTFTPLSTRLAPMSGFLTGLVRGIVGVVAVLVALDSLGISVTPVLASLGVGSVAVALALQETLGNFFAGIAILADHPVRVGEHVKVEPDPEGQILTIGWRTTSLLDLQGNLVVVPNSTLARSIIRNYDRPSAGESLSVKVVVESGTPVGAALEAARAAVMPISGTVLVTNIDPAGIELTASLPVTSRTERGAARSRALTAIAEAFASAGIALARTPGAPPAK